MSDANCKAEIKRLAALLFADMEKNEDPQMANMARAVATRMVPAVIWDM